MKLLLTTNGRLVKNSAGEYYTPVVYGCSFFQRYFEVFDDIYLVAHCETLSEIPENYIRVDGKGLHILEVPFPHGKVQYIKKYLSINKAIKKAVMGTDFDVAILRIPDQLAFQVFNFLKKKKVPVGAEIIANSWDLFDCDISNSILRPFIRRIWDYNERKICRQANGTAFVTKHSIQQRYKPNTEPLDHFTTNYSSASIDSIVDNAREYTDIQKPKILLHVAADIGGTVKGHKELIESIAMLKDEGITVNAVIVGGGTLSPEVQSIIDENDLSSQIRLTGRLQKDELKKEYENADIFVFPSYREGLPRVVIEAMSNALPCIATELDGIKELLNENSLVKVKDSVALKEKIKEFVANNALLEEKSRENLENAKLYTKEALQSKRNEFFLNLCELAGKGRKREKLLFLINTLSGGGAEKVLVDLVNTINKSKYDVTLLSLLGGVNEKNLSTSVRHRQIIKTESPILTKLLLVFWQKVVSYNTFHKNFIGNNYDIEVAYLQGFPTRVIAKGNSDAKKLCFVHTDIRSNTTFQKVYSSKDMLESEYKKFDKICFVSETAKDGFEEYVCKLDTEALIYNVVDFSAVKKLSNETIEDGFKSDSFKIVTVGRLCEQKAYDRLIEAARTLEKEEFNFEILIIGEGSDRSKLEKLIQENNISSVKLIGYKENPYPYYKAADLFVCSSVAEGYSTAVSEAVALAVPVLTTDCSGMKELLDNGNNGMIVENSADGIINGLRSILSDEELQRRLKSTAADYADKLLSNKNIEEYYNLFDEVLK